MGNKLLILLTTLSLASCGNMDRTGGKLNAGQDAGVAAARSNGTMCFRRIGGAGMRDTVQVHLDLQGKQVSGAMDVLLYEKDSRRGSLSGVISSDGIIRATYYFVQEGMRDTFNLEFRLTGDALLERPAAIDPGTGRARPDTTAAFGGKLDKVPCW